MPGVLITAGATRNPIDAIRYISAFSSGRTGAWLASRLAPHRQVRLLGSAEACLRATGTCAVEEYRSTRDLMARMERWVRAHPDGVVIHAAAVGDYEADTTAAKIPSGSAELLIRLRPTPKIVDHVRAWSDRVRLVSFKAASPETTEQALRELARAQRRRTRSDLVFANIIGRLGELVLLEDADTTERFEDRSVALEALARRALGW